MSNSILPMLLDADDDDLTLPLIVAKKWQFPLAYVETENGLYYAVQDWLRGLTGLKDVRKTWFRLKHRMEIFNILQISKLCIKLPYISSNRKTYQTDYTPSEGLYLITQCLRPDVGIRNPVLSVFALGEAVETVHRPKSTRLDNVYILRCEWAEYQDVYKVGRSSSPSKRISSLDHQFPFSITIITCSRVLNASYVESQLHQHFANQRVRNEWFRLSTQDLDYALSFIEEQAAATAKLLGMDIATGKPLLE